MGYIKKAHKEILKILDNRSFFYDGWDNFVNKQAIFHNLIIKSNKNQCFCTNCKQSFTSKMKVNQEVKCPHCHNTYLIKRSNLKYYEFKDYLSILDRINDTFIIRYFELKTTIDSIHNQHTSIVEFAREIPRNDYYRDVYINDRVSRCQCYIHIYHSNSDYINDERWRKYTRYYSLIDYSIVFPSNIKKLLKNTEFKYSCIWDLAKHSKYIDLLKLIKKNDDYSINRIERLTKMKLYNLALCADKFSCFGSFEKVFGISKDYYPFMRKYNITYRQLQLLKLLKEKNVNKIRYLEKFIHYGDSTYDLEEISKYISLNRFIKYSKMHHGNIKTYLFKDYLRFAKLLGFDLKNNRYAFPSNLREEHDRLSEQYSLQCNQIINNAIIKRGKELSVNKYQDNKFVIFPAPTALALKDESKQQNNCVRTYAEKYAVGTCDIYFMRNINKPSQSLVTIEVKDNKVVQSRIKNNQDPNKKQLEFINKWEQKVLKGVA